MSTILAIVLFLGALLVYICILGLVQYLLCRLTPPWPGLILPVLSGLSALGAGSYLFLFAIAHTRLGIFILSLVVLALLLPTVIFIIIYRVTRRRFRQQDEVTRMNLQDL